jgi:MFS family permease
MPLSLFRDRRFALYMSGNTISWMGTWMQRTAIGWLSWELTESSSWVGAIVLAQYLPLVFFAPLFGVLVDHSDKRRFALGCQTGLLLVSLALFAAYQLGVLNIYVLLVLCLFLGVGNAAYQPIRMTLIHDIAPTGMLTPAIGMNSMLFNTTRLAGPMAGGLSIVAVGVGYTFFINAATFIPMFYALMVLRFHTTEVKKNSNGVLAQLREGVRYLLSQPQFRELFLLSLTVSILARGVLELLPAFAGGVFDAGSSGLATLMAVAGFGGVASSFLLSGTRDDQKLIRLVTIGCGMIGVFIALFGGAPNFTVALVWVAGVAAMGTLSTVGMQAILQHKLDGNYRGRVVSLWGMTAVAGPALGGSLLGLIAQFTDLRGVAISSGILCALICTTILFRSPTFGLNKSQHND